MPFASTPGGGSWKHHEGAATAHVSLLLAEELVDPRNLGFSIGLRFGRKHAVRL